VLITIRAEGALQLPQMTQTWSLCARACEMMDEKIQETTAEVGISVGGVRNVLHKDLNTQCLCQHIGR
jgi:hypothetical protein